MPQQGQPPNVPASVPLRYQRDTKRAYCRGIDLNDPVDSIKEGFYPILENVRAYTDGILQPRQGITQVASSVITSQTPVHSVRRLNNTLNNTFTRVVGVGTKLATGQTSFTAVQYNSSDVAFSGNPLAMVPWRPSQSPVSWMYVADSSAMYKVTYDGSTVTTHKVGVAPPTAPPTVELDKPIWTFVDEFSATTHWTADGTIAAAPTAQTRVNTTSSHVLYDSGTTGWACIVPADMTNIGPGTVLYAVWPGPTTENILVSEVYRGSSATTISVIRYDNTPTNTGVCTIVPTAPVEFIKRNAVVLLNSDTTNGYARITEVITGPNNAVIAFKCNTGATTFSAGQALQIIGSFRTYTTNPAAITGGDVITDSPTNKGYIQSALNGGAGGGNGTLTDTPTSAIDFTKMALYSPAVSTAILDNDYFHFSFKCTDLSKIGQLRLMFDCGDGSFNQNYFYYVVTPSDLVAAAKFTQTALTTRLTQIQNNIISRGGLEPFDKSESGFEIQGSSDLFSNSEPNDSPDVQPSAPRGQTGTGDSQYSEIRFRRGECVRVGTDWSKGWQAINKIRLEITVNPSATPTIQIGSLSIWGGYSPDIGQVGFPYIYRYRYRSTATGATSNWSPATRSGQLSLRLNNIVTCTASSAPEVDIIDIQRWGGTVTEWANVGSISNSTAVFTDTVDDDFASAAVPDSVGQINFQPWISAQTPTRGAATVVGSMVSSPGGPFSLSWLAGTFIRVNGILTTIRRMVTTSLLEVEDCVAAGGGIPWEIPEPFIQISLPCLWGPSNGWFFACGDPTNAGRLYFSNQNNPDATGGFNTQGSAWIDVTGPSEPLQNGLVYNGRPYVFSSEKLYEIVEIADGQFITRETPTGKGLMYRWAFCVGPRIWFLSKDGIYETDGGIAKSITYDQLFPLFPKEGTLGIAVNGFNPPNMVNTNLTVSGITAAAANFFRFCYEDGYLHFYYPDTNNRMRALTYSLGNFSFVWSESSQTGWYPDVFNPGGSNTGILMGYLEEGAGVHTLLLGGADTTTGKLYIYGGTTDNGTAIPWHFRQGSWDAGDRRADKLWADFVVDSDPGSGTINVAAGINNYGSTLTLVNPSGTTTITGSGRSQTAFDINSGNGAEGKNFAVDLSGTSTDARLYLIEPSFTSRPEDSFLRATQYDDAGYEGEKFFQGIEIEADTHNIARTVQIQYDGGTLGDTLTIQHNGRLQKPYSFASAFVAHLARLIPTDTNHLWKLFKWRWVWEPEPPLVTVWDTQATSHGHIGFIHLKAIWITHTSTADLTLTITRMDDNTSQAFTIPNSGGVRARETYLLLGPPEFCKGKTFKYKITQASNVPFRIYQRNCGVLVKPWGSAQAYGRWVGWGADSGDGAAQI